MPVSSDRESSYCYIPGINARHGPSSPYMPGWDLYRDALSIFTSSAGNGDVINTSSQHSPGQRHLSYWVLKAQKPMRWLPPERKLQALCELNTGLCKSSTLRRVRKPPSQIAMPLSGIGISPTRLPPVASNMSLLVPRDRRLTPL